MSKQIDQIMNQYLPGIRITEQEYREAAASMSSEDFEKQYYKVQPPKSSASYYRREPHDIAELTPILLHAILEVQEKQELSQKEIHSLLEAQRQTEHNTRVVKNIMLALVIIDVITALFFLLPAMF